jgi:protein required for attachment to host cells
MRSYTWYYYLLIAGLDFSILQSAEQNQWILQVACYLNKIAIKETTMKLTWILVADSSRARIFTADTPSSSLEEIEDFSHAEGRLHDREMTTDLPGRIKSTGGGGHAFEQPTDPKQHEADNFAHSVAQYLEDAHNANKFEHLLIVAAPSFLGLLRDQLSEPVKKRVRFELNKDISMLSAADIREHLPQYLPNL